MTQADLTKESAQHCIEVFEDLCKTGLPKSKVANYIGHMNDIFSFFEACKKEFKEAKE